MSNIEKIKAEIERQRSFIEGLFIEGDNSFYDGQDDAYNHLLAFIDSLPDENNPEPYNPVYDEDYLNEKIAKATKSWGGVDVNKMLADCRGYEEKPSEDLNDEIKKFIEEYGYERGSDKLLIAIVARHFAEWQEKQDLKWAGEIHKNGYNLCKEQMMKDAVEGEVIYDLGGFFRIKSEAIDGAKYKVGSWVKLIIVKED